MRWIAGLTFAFALACGGAQAQQWTPAEADFVARDVAFASGERLGEVRLHYATLGSPHRDAAGAIDNAVLILHGTGGTGRQFLQLQFADELYGPGQPLDIAKYWIVLPDNIGHGRSSKPSDGMRMGFPKYDYDDMVALQHKLVTEGLGLKRARLIIGQSMGGMHVWIWGTSFPAFADALVPMASQPTAMSSRNWMMRRMIIDTIKNDPDYQGGNYTTPPKAFRSAAVFFAIATNGGTLAWQKRAPTSAAADTLLDAMLLAAPTADANDYLYSWESSRDYDPSSKLNRITASVLVVNAADDERNPPETGLTETAVKRINGVRLLLIPASEDTRGHGTTGMAKFYARELRELLETAPRRGS